MLGCAAGGSTKIVVVDEVFDEIPNRKGSWARVLLIGAMLTCGVVWYVEASDTVH
jgi:hypothetical protein